MSLTTIDQLPGQETEELLTEYQILLTYLQHGERNKQNYLKSNERVVVNQKLRELLIRAGFVDLGLGSWTGSEYYLNSTPTPKKTQMNLLW